MVKKLHVHLQKHKRIFPILTGVLLALAAISVYGVWMIYQHWFPPVFRLTDADLGNEVVMVTNYGTIDITLSRKSPFANSQFTRLVRSGFYDGTRIHRVVKDLLLEGGDPLTKDVNLKEFWGEGGSAISFKNETHWDDQIKEGTLVMAGSGDGTYNSHFYIITKDSPWMAGKHTIIGQVKFGLDVVHAIEAIPTNVTDTPTQDVVVTKMSIL